MKVAIDNGDLETGVFPISQAIGLIKDLPTCKEVIERTVAEAQELVEAAEGKNSFPEQSFMTGYLDNNNDRLRVPSQSHMQRMMGYLYPLPLVI